MRKHAFILLLFAAIGAALFVRVRSMVDASRDDHRTADASVDAGTALRAITGASDANVKPWVLDDVAFKNAHADRRWIVGRSGKPAGSEAEATESARADAARQLCPILRARVRHWPGDARWLDSEVDEAVRAGTLDADTFVERFDRPYGTVYTGAVLLDVSNDHLAPLLRQASHDLSARHRKIGRRLAGAAAMLAAAWVGCVLLDGATRGYLTLRLRVTAAAVTIGVLLFV